MWDWIVVCRAMHVNSLSGTVPAEIGNLASLNYLCGCGVCDVYQNVCVSCVWRVQCVLYVLCGWSDAFLHL